MAYHQVCERHLQTSTWPSSFDWYRLLFGGEGVDLQARRLRQGRVSRCFRCLESCRGCTPAPRPKRIRPRRIPGSRSSGLVRPSIFPSTHNDGIGKVRCQARVNLNAACPKAGKAQFSGRRARLPVWAVRPAPAPNFFARDALGKASPLMAVDRSQKCDVSFSRKAMLGLTKLRLCALGF